MKKIVILCLIAVVTIGGFLFFTAPQIGDKTPYDTVNDFPDASLKVVEVSEEEQKVTVEFAYSGENELNYGSYHVFEILQEDGWHIIESKQEFSWPDIAYTVEKGQTRQETYGWAGLGRLPAGHYRIVVEVDDFVESGIYKEYVLAAEFDIDVFN